MVLSVKALALLVGVAGMGLLLSRPSIPYYAIVAVVPIYVSFGNIVTPTRLVVLAALGAMLVHAWSRRSRLPTAFVTPEGPLALGLFACVAVSVFANGAVAPLTRLAPYIMYGIIFFSVLSFVRTVERFRGVMWTLLFVGFIESTLVFVEVLFGFAPFGGWHAELAKDNVDAVRVAGTHAHPITLAGFLMLTTTLALTTGLLTTKPRVRVISVILVLMFVCAWWFTYSRSSMIGIVAMVWIAVACSSRKGHALAIAGACAGLVILGSYGFSLVALIRDIDQLKSFGEIVVAGGVGSGAESLIWRIENWVMSWNMFVARPLIGFGPDGIEARGLDYLPSWALQHEFVPLGTQQVTSVPHNMFLLVAAESGIFALAFFVALWVWALTSIRRAARHPRLRPYAIMLLVIVVGLSTLYMFNPSPRELWLVLALAASLGRMAQDEEAFGTRGFPALVATNAIQETRYAIGSAESGAR